MQTHRAEILGAARHGEGGRAVAAVARHLRVNKVAGARAVGLLEDWRRKKREFVRERRSRAFPKYPPGFSLKKALGLEMKY